MNIRTFYLLKCYKNGNNVISESRNIGISGAITTFKNLFPNLKLDENGYYKIADVSYCIATGMGE